MIDDTDPTPSSEGVRPLTMYTRPGCMFSRSLSRGLERAGIGFEEVDIWQDESGAAFVRSVTGGDETVPTVRVGSIALVNPSTDDVLRAMESEAPAHLPDGYEPRQPGMFTRLLTKLLGGDESAR